MISPLTVSERMLTLNTPRNRITYLDVSVTWSILHRPNATRWINQYNVFTFPQLFPGTQFRQLTWESKPVFRIRPDLTLPVIWRVCKTLCYRSNHDIPKATQTFTSDSKITFFQITQPRVYGVMSSCTYLQITFVNRCARFCGLCPSWHSARFDYGFRS